MFKATKGVRAQYLLNEVQAAAFQNNGWDVSQGESDELSDLRAEADALGIMYRANTGAKKLREQIEDFKAKLPKEEASE